MPLSAPLKHVHKALGYKISRSWSEHKPRQVHWRLQRWHSSERGAYVHCKMHQWRHDIVITSIPIITFRSFRSFGSIRSFGIIQIYWHLLDLLDLLDLLGSIATLEIFFGFCNGPGNRIDFFSSTHCAFPWRNQNGPLQCCCCACLAVTLVCMVNSGNISPECLESIQD